MKNKTNFNRNFMRSQFLFCGLTLILIVAVPIFRNSDAAELHGHAFAAPEEAVKALKSALAERDLPALRSIFGPELSDIVNPDPVEATNEFRTVASKIEESTQLVAAGKQRMLLQFGHEATLFPVPIVENGGRWYFDTEAGVEELINRRIGRNELTVLEVIRTYVQAQREYASKDLDGDEVLEYAQRFGSTAGTKDGLFWSPDLDGTLSPLGPLAAEAEAAGYRKREDVPRQSFHGYYFKILTRQGKNAPGGAYDYIINGNMIGGFGLIAWPAEYDETGVMTFIVNQQGRVYQKDLGNKTGEMAEDMKIYDPDKTWSLSPD